MGIHTIALSLLGPSQGQATHLQLQDIVASTACIAHMTDSLMALSSTRWRMAARITRAAAQDMATVLMVSTVNVNQRGMEGRVAIMIAPTWLARQRRGLSLTGPLRRYSAVDVAPA